MKSKKILLAGQVIKNPILLDENGEKPTMTFPLAVLGAKKETVVRVFVQDDIEIATVKEGANICVEGYLIANTISQKAVIGCIAEEIRGAIA